MILSEDWRTNARGKRNPGYQQSREHVRLVDEERYQLKTFPMEYSDARKDSIGIGPATIGGFTPTLSDRSLSKIGNAWYASDDTDDIRLAEEIEAPERYAEGAKTTVIISAIERSAKARKACIRHHGSDCAACGLNFKTTYGPLGDGFIHVHHKIPVRSVPDEHEVIPATDLAPVCPNCHAMIHRVSPPLTVEQLRDILDRQRSLHPTPDNVPIRQEEELR